MVKISVVFHSQLEFEFGDLIAFPKCNCLGKSVYKHYAVYVGDKEFDGKKKKRRTYLNVQVSVIDLETTRTLFAQVKIRQFLDQPLCKISHVVTCQSL